MTKLAQKRDQLFLEATQGRGGFGILCGPYYKKPMRPTLTDAKEAQYRCLLKRVCRVYYSDEVVGNNDRTAALEILAKMALKTEPVKTGGVVTGFYKQAAEAWVKANNEGSTNQQLYHDELERQERLQEANDRFLGLVGIGVRYPGLYPSFTYKGESYFTLADVLAVFSKEPS